MTTATTTTETADTATEGDTRSTRAISAASPTFEQAVTALARAAQARAKAYTALFELDDVADDIGAPLEGARRAARAAVPVPAILRVPYTSNIVKTVIHFRDGSEAVIESGTEWTISTIPDAIKHAAGDEGLCKTLLSTLSDYWTAQSAAAAAVTSPEHEASKAAVAKASATVSAASVVFFPALKALRAAPVASAAEAKVKASTLLKAHGARLRGRGVRVEGVDIGWLEEVFSTMLSDLASLADGEG